MALLLLLLISIVSLFVIFFNKGAFNKRTEITLLTGFIAIHTQLIIGLLLYFISPLGFSNFSLAALSNPITGFFLIHHPLTMILTAFLVTKGYQSIKKTLTDRQKTRRALIFYTLGLVLLLTAVPWFLWF